jgi:hypothetical protein
MPSRSEITHFGAGPASLPTDVLEEAAKALVDYNGTGLGSKEPPEALITPSSIFSRDILKLTFVRCFL